jgi:elongation factor G
MQLVTLPIGEENDFKGVVDLVRNQAIVYRMKKVWEQLTIFVPIPKTCSMKLRIQIDSYEAVADYDEHCLKKFMEDENSITEEEINIALELLLWIYYHSAIAGSSLKNKEVQFMLDAVCKYLPFQWIKSIEGIHLMMLNY